ncbi:NAD(P)-dependent oxidoreductase [Glycomyces terrestris]|uniref:NAD-dependent epimerase/dehydratase family protein n=1 Tax=Glycomyces terrestris TaxID=2493553 RepID=A0A426UWH4_9ACTN|nr:NAD(P)H-binding protein [Glycomyces terrestris]RRR98549.1 NAD-dependent epimerase/dehydratase family protein [Glycomyces terrestris]
MRLVVIGATGGIGRAVTAQALAADHHVTAVVRDLARLDPEIPAAAVDLADPDPHALRAALAGADAVLSCVGPRRKDETGIVSRATAAIADAMRDTGTRRIVAVSGIGLSTVPSPNRPRPLRREPGAGLAMTLFTLPLVRAVIGAHMSDVAAAEELLAASGLDWTAVRLPRLTDGPLTGTYQVAHGTSLPRAFRLSRADAAHYMLRAAADRRTAGTHVTVAY